MITRPEPGAQRHGRTLREAATAARFASVGLVATALHLSLVYLLLAGHWLPPQAANLVAFLLAFMVSFAGHQRWTFRSRADPRQARRRFFIVAVSAYGANSLLLAALLHLHSLPPRFSALLAATCVPLFSYLASRLWAFAPAPAAKP